MKCFKCGGIWETNSKFKFCPFCGYQLPEENISNMNGTAKMIKSFVERFGVEVLKDRERCASLFRTFIPDQKERALLGFILESGAVDEIINCQVGYSDLDKERLCLRIKEKAIRDYFSEQKISEAINWYATALLGIELKATSSYFHSSAFSSTIQTTGLTAPNAPVSTASSPAKKNIANTTLEEFEKLIRSKYALEMVKCPAGSFLMGSPVSELGRFRNEVQHKVCLTRDFYIGKFPVTQALYKMIMGDNPAQFKGNTNPVECVIWSKAIEFCEKLNLATDSFRPPGYKFDLPTEAQWEYACRAGTDTALNNNKNLTAFTGNCFNLDEVAWYNKNSFAKTHPCGMKAPNNWGIYDMLGNVWEWCKDWYSDYSATDNVDPKGPSIGSLRVSRGGSWEDSPNTCRSAYRGSGRPVREFNSLGFRLALVAI